MVTVGVGKEWHGTLFRAIGAMDVAVAAAAVASHWAPNEDWTWWLFSWAGTWGAATAAMRPLSGESPLEFVERTGNFGPALYLAATHPKRKDAALRTLSVFGAGLAVLAVGAATLRTTKVLA